MGRAKGAGLIIIPRITIPDQKVPRWCRVQNCLSACEPPGLGVFWATRGGKGHPARFDTVIGSVLHSSLAAAPSIRFHLRAECSSLHGLVPHNGLRCYDAPLFSLGAGQRPMAANRSSLPAIIVSQLKAHVSKQHFSPGCTIARSIKKFNMIRSSDLSDVPLTLAVHERFASCIPFCVLPFTCKQFDVHFLIGSVVDRQYRQALFILSSLT